ILLSRWFLVFFSTVSEQLTISPASTISLSRWTVAFAIVVGMAISLMAATEPAMRATARHPLEVLSSVRRPGSGGLHRSPPPALVLALLGVVLICASNWLPLGALFRLVLIFVATISLVVIVFGIYLPDSILRVTPTLEHIPRIGAFLGTSLSARPL